MYETCYYIFNSLNWDDLENELGNNLVKEEKHLYVLNAG